MPKFFAYIYKNIEIFFLSFIFSVLFTYFLRDPIFQFLSTGKSLAGRNLLIQISFATILFFILLFLLFYVLGRQIGWLIKNYYFSAATISLIPLVAYSIIGSYSRFVADDYSSATLAVHKGVFGATWDWYIHWSGRFSASFLDSLVGYIGPGIMPFITGSAILAWLVGLVFVVQNVYLAEKPLKGISLSLLVSAMILITTFEVTPLLSQSLYWGQGMRSVILPLILATCLVSVLYFCIVIKKSSSTRWLFLAGLLSFFAGGFGETYVVLQTSGYLMMLIYTIIENQEDWKSNILPILLVGFICSLLAMGITIAAPGNKIRQAYFPPPPDIFNLVKISLVSFGKYFQFLLNSPERILNSIVLLLTGVFAGWHCKNSSIPSKPNSKVNRISRFMDLSYPKTILVLWLISIGLLFVCFVPAAYGMSTNPPERTQLIPTFVFSVSIAVFGLVSGRYLLFVMQTKNRQQPLVKNLKFFVWLSFLLFAYYSFHITNKTLVDQANYAHFADVFDRADAMIRQAKADGKDSVKVPEVHNHFGLSDFGAGTTYWLDEAVNSYYGIPVIVNKNMK